MKKLLLGSMVCGSLITGAVFGANHAHAGDDDVAALLLSFALPGTGEWYNSGFQGGFPFVECVVGVLCPCIRLASVFDAAAGKTDSGFRIDFWSSVD